jgi:hypothetical protein
VNDALVSVELREIAHGRTGDKGDRANISIIPYAPSGYAPIAAQITQARMRDAFAHRNVGRVARFDLPALSAFNFVLDDVLQGGVNGSLNLDGHGKSLSFLALSMPVEVPPEVLEDARKARRAVEGGI